MFKYALIKDDRVDRIGKTVLILLFASLSMVASFKSFTQTGDNIKLALAAATYLEILVIACRGSKVRNCWKSIPMFSFTIVSITECIRHFVIRPGFSSQLEYSEALFLIFIRTVMLMLCILISVKIATLDDISDSKDNDGVFIRLYLCALLAVHSVTFLVYIVRHDSGRQFIAGFYSEIFFYLSILILSLPKQGVLNIRRILIMPGMTAVITSFAYAMLKLLAAIYDGFDETKYDLFMISLIIAAQTMIWCGDNKTRPELKVNDYDYSMRERLLKTIGWNNAREEHVNRDYYLESGLKRDFSREYASRLYNDMSISEDISLIQQRLREIKEKREKLMLCNNELSRRRADYLGNEAADYLGKLSIAYGFDTGINSCPIEMLI